MKMVKKCDTVMAVDAHISGDLDLFLPLKNSGRARFSIWWTLGEKR